MSLLLLLAFSVRADAAEGEAASYDRLRGVEYVKRGDEPLLAEVYVPRGEGPFPGILVVHGGGWRGGNRFQLTHAAKALAERGYTAVAIDYRLAPKHVFPAQIDDCKSAVRWMRTNAAKYKIDPSHVGGYGYSAGGHLVALLGASDDDKNDKTEGADATKRVFSTRLQAVAAGGAPCDFNFLPAENELLAYWLGGSRAKKAEAYRLASPTTFVSADDPPMFFFHGDSDMIVPRLSSVWMSARLAAVNVKTSVYTVPNAGHYAAARDKTALEESLQFLDETLRPAASAAAKNNDASVQ
jgi:acetyl esterase/lipase